MTFNPSIGYLTLLVVASLVVGSWVAVLVALVAVALLTGAPFWWFLTGCHCGATVAGLLALRVSR